MGPHTLLAPVRRPPVDLAITSNRLPSVFPISMSRAPPALQAQTPIVFGVILPDEVCFIVFILVLGYGRSARVLGC